MEGGVEALSSGRTLLLSVDSVFLHARVSSSYLLGVFADTSALLQTDDFMCSQHSQAAKE